MISGADEGGTAIREGSPDHSHAVAVRGGARGGPGTPCPALQEGAVGRALAGRSLAGAGHRPVGTGGPQGAVGGIEAHPSVVS